MKVIKNVLSKTKIELSIEVEYKDFEGYIVKAAERLSLHAKIEGFRPGKAPVEIIKKTVGELVLLEEAARILIAKKVDDIIIENTKPRIVIGQPQIAITKIAPNNPLEYKVTLDLLPEVKIDNYAGLKIKMDKAEIGDKEVEKVIDQLKEAQIQDEIIDRELREGDKAIVSIKMFLDNVPLDGGQANDLPVVLGKNYIIEGFDKNLIGAKKSDVKNFSLFYPVDHHQKNLAGKKVEFEVTIKDVFERIIPEVNEEFVAKFGLKSVDELKTNIKNSLVKEKEEEIKRKVELDIFDGLIKRAEFEEIPEFLIENEVDAMISELERNTAQYGGKFEDYLNSISKTKEDLAKEFLPEAEKRIKSALIVRYIAETEKIEAEQKEIDRAKHDIAHYYHHDKAMEEQINSKEYEKQLSAQIVNKKVLDKLRELNCE